MTDSGQSDIAWGPAPAPREAAVGARPHPEGTRGSIELMVKWPNLPVLVLPMSAGEAQALRRAIRQAMQ